MGKRCKDCGSEECRAAEQFQQTDQMTWENCLSRQVGQRDMIIAELKRENERKEEIIKRRDERIAELEDSLQEARWAAMGDDL